MQILRVFNNNVVLARRTGSNAGTPAGEDTEDVIVTGRGIGFQAKAGDAVDPAKVVKVFVPASGRDPDHSAAMLAAVPGEFIQLVLEAMDRAHVPDTLRSKLTLVVALADHVHSAVNRGISISIRSRLRSAISTLRISRWPALCSRRSIKGCIPHCLSLRQWR